MFLSRFLSFFYCAFCDDVVCVLCSCLEPLECESDVGGFGGDVGEGFLLECLWSECFLCAMMEDIVGFFAGVWFELEGVGLEAAVCSFF